MRFGLTYVDYKGGGARYPKDSFFYLSNLFGAGGGAELPVEFKWAGPGGAGLASAQAEVGR